MTMKQGKTLTELGKELQRQRNARKDFVADTRNLQMTTSGSRSVLIVAVGNNRQEFAVNELAHQQIASRLNIPYRYYQKMQTEQPTLLDNNVNTWFQQTPERRMVRCLMEMYGRFCPTAHYDEESFYFRQIVKPSATI